MSQLSFLLSKNIRESVFDIVLQNFLHLLIFSKEISDDSSFAVFNYMNNFERNKVSYEDRDSDGKNANIDPLKYKLIFD